MKLTLLPSAVGDAAGSRAAVPFQRVAQRHHRPRRRLSWLARHAGAAGQHSPCPADAQPSRSRRHLPIFLENAYEGRAEGVHIYAGSAHARLPAPSSLQRSHLARFRRPIASDKPFLPLVPFEAGQTIELDGLQITAVALDHVVPVHGFLIRDAASSIVFVTDTGPTDAIWRAANTVPNLKAVFLEATFPDELALAGGRVEASDAGDVCRRGAQADAAGARRGDAPESAVSGGSSDSYSLLGIAAVELAQFGKPYVF